LKIDFFDLLKKRNPNQTAKYTVIFLFQIIKNEAKNETKIQMNESISE